MIKANVGAGVGLATVQAVDRVLKNTPRSQNELFYLEGSLQRAFAAAMMLEGRTGQSWITY